MQKGDPKQLEQWHADFEKAGIHEVQAHIDRNEYVAAQRLEAFRWLKDIETRRERREAHTLWYVKWTFWAAVVAVLVGIVGAVVTLVH